MGLGVACAGGGDASRVGTPSLFWYTECVMIVTLGLGVEEGGADFLGHADVACLKIWAIWIQALVMLEL